MDDEPSDTSAIVKTSAVDSSDTSGIFRTQQSSVNHRTGKATTLDVEPSETSDTSDTSGDDMAKGLTGKAGILQVLAQWR